MQVNLHSNQGNQFTSYDENSVTINQSAYTTNIIVSNHSIEELSITSIDDLDTDKLDTILKHKPDIIIFGTGNQIKYPSTEVLLKLQHSRIGFEVMSIAALCRTFNYLIGEGRNVAALIVFN